jgi:DNA-binding SARP family transcriptional activator
MTLVTVALLRDVELRVGDQVIVVARPRLRALLCALALRAGRVVPVDILIAQVWGEAMPDHPRTGLYTLVNQLRKLVGPDVIRTEQTGYLLDIPPDAVDALRFERLLDSVDGLSPEKAREVLAEALALWHTECDAAPYLVERYLHAVERRIDLDLELGRHNELVAELRRLTAQHPLREPLWARLMTALYRSGRHAEALEQYQTIRALLIDTMGTDPSAELRGLYLKVLAADDALPARSDPVVPRQLPPNIAAFTGRATDLSALNDAFEDDGTDRPPLIIAVHGPGGSGKTTLALHWAHRARDRFPDGQLHLDMRGFGPGEPIDPATALDIMLRAVGVPSARIPPRAEERAALWRTTLSGRRMLLLIDNARDAAQVRPLLPGSGSVVLVTSRNELRGLAVNDGARRLTLNELPVDEAIRLVQNLIGAGRSAAEPAALGELVALCGRLPLALVVAAQQAVRFPDTPIAELVADLRAACGRLDVLSDPEDSTTDLRAVFSWSYHALNADTARAFGYLGFHPTAEIDLPVAAVLLRSSPAVARRLLDTLVSLHLLEQDQRGRYRFHDLLQVYAVERGTAEQPAGEVRALMRRIVDWYLHTLLQARVTAFTRTTLDVAAPAEEFVRPLEFTDIGSATAWYVRHRATLLATVEYAAEHGYDRHCWQLAYLLRHFHETQRHVDDGMRAAELAIRCAERSGEDEAMIYAAHTMGAACTGTRQFETAERWQLKALDLSERAGDHAMASTASLAIGLGQLRSGRVPEAIDWLERAVTTARRSSSSVSLAHALLNLGAVEGMSGKLDESLAHSGQALALYREMNAPYYEAFALGNLAEATMETGALAQGLVYADAALALLGANEDQVTMPDTLMAKGRILTELGEPAAARETWQQALRILSRTSDPRAAEVESLIEAAHLPDPRWDRKRSIA